mmetsp:Transcript_1635/g.4020  ORF Transcript_1635/g.4020 Transcript_1635/m.4020 type:complete len:219 (+) Transcript_1635:177-833(+)|eukprot:CAMPEP_0119555306 /NCGR_PEP_ID=MMETSP1352-20130426/7568_1 /TAXON_ID=265584 /ORGANISM="Stauroneis constricta, Strain CCMP1120" /LENGTH=218 /DNA_ID=CAMNT_0007602051 /DNA_START=148 /DNA_END=804 /DNA_ORIENTATION=+
MGKKGGGNRMRIKQVGPKGMGKAMMNPLDDLAIAPEEMIQLPPPPDRNYQIFWPIHETFTMNPDKFMVVYPSYLDSTKTAKQGRRIAKEDSVDMPTISDISQALQQLNMRHVLQPHKGYPRDCTTLWDNPGRVKVELPPITEIMHKKMLLREIGKIIPTLESRKKRLEQQAKDAEIAAAKAKEEAAKERQIQQQREKQRQQTSSSTKTNNKKKGKKRR